MTDIKKLEKQKLEDYKLAIENVKKVICYLKGKYPLNYDYYSYSWGINVEINSKDDKEAIDENGSYNFGILLAGQKDGKIKLTTNINYNGYYYDYDANPDGDKIGNQLDGKQVVKLYELYQEAIKLAEELQGEFDFIEVEE